MSQYHHFLVRESDSRRIQISQGREEKTLEIIMIHVVDLLKLGFVSHFCQILARERKIMDFAFLQRARDQTFL